MSDWSNYASDFDKNWPGSKPPAEDWAEQEPRAETNGCKSRAKQKPKDPANAAFTEDKLALAFAAKHGDALRYCHHHGAWFAWDGNIWKREETQLAFHWCRELIRDLNTEGTAQLSKAATASNVEKFARADRAFAVTFDTWDNDLRLAGTPAGTINLQTGQLVTPKPTDFITKSTAVAPAKPGTVPSRWLRFLDDATRGDKDLIRFLQQIAGYSLTGDTSEHALFFIHGDGGNGKGVLIHALTTILGDYAKVAPMETFTASRFDRHPTEMAMLRGARFVTAQETEEGRRWAESRIKTITGGDKVTARFMRENFFTYQPQFKLIITGNHKPALNSVGEAERRRFNIIPFTNKPTDPDPHLSEKLVEEYPAILRWAINGCLDWQQNGLVRPEVVLAATAEYFDAQDVPSQWLEECCQTDLSVSNTETSANLYRSWRAYAEAAGEHPGSQKAFGDMLAKKGFERRRGAGGVREYKGIGLKVKPSYNPGASHD